MSNELINELFLAPNVMGVKRGVPPSAQHTRDLTEADMAALEQNRGAQVPAIQRLRSSHHALARCLATGMNQLQAAAVTGYDRARIVQLLRDPSFNALVEEYKAESKEIMADVTQRMANLSLDALEVLQERLNEKPEDFSLGMLLDVVKAMADRTGHGPGQEVNFNVKMGSIDRPPRESHEEWLERRKRELDMKVIDGTAS